MKFFVGGFKPEADQEMLYEHFKRVAGSCRGGTPSKARIYGLVFNHDGNRVDLKVGEQHFYRPHQTIAAIFECPGVYVALPITSRGQVNEPIYAGERSVISVVPFDEAMPLTAGA